MDLKIKDQYFLVGGASSGFGLAVSKALLREEARVIAVARNMDKLQELKKIEPSAVEILQADLSQPETADKIEEIIDHFPVSGALINSGGPPAMSFMETLPEDWDRAYRQLLRWKADLSKRLVERMRKDQYGRIVYLESVSVKQPIENLVLSNSLRMAVAGFVKSLSREVAADGITLNLLAPGYHDTAALNRIFENKSKAEGITVDAAKQAVINNIPVGKLGSPDDFASLALWLLSPHSGYITGQTFSVDGGVVQYVFG